MTSHANKAEALVNRYHDGQGSDQLAIAHALLAINETLQPRNTNARIQYLEDALTETYKKINKAKVLADAWDNPGNNPTEEAAYLAQQLREVLR